MNIRKDFIECSCGGHFVVMCTDNDDKYDYIYLSFFQYGNGEKSFLLQLQHIWHIIRYGTPFLDMVCLDKKEAIKLKDKLNLYIKNK